MRWELLSPALIVSGALVIIALERFFPYDARQKLLREGLFTDLVWYGLLQSYLLGLVISRLVAALDHSSGFSARHIVSSWPIVAQLFFFFVTHDLYIYGFHRLQHHSRILWRTHEAHHAVKDVDWIAGARSHSLEILINQSIEYAPLVLLGAHPDVILMKGALDAVWGMYIHSNIDVRSGLLQRVINGPEMHRWHHSDHKGEGEMNFATKLAIWDWLFGTAFLPRDRKPERYGLWDAVAFPTNYFAQHAFAFRPFAPTSDDPSFAQKCMERGDEARLNKAPLPGLIDPDPADGARSPVSAALLPRAPRPRGPADARKGGGGG